MIPESEWTKGQREFIGTTFETPKGGVLTVVGVSEKKNGRVAVFVLECSICSLDTELWPCGAITGTKSNLVSGNHPCGCSNSPRWTPKQDLIHTNRILAEKLPNLRAIDTIELAGRNRKFILECDICSKDTELWPCGAITSPKCNLVKGCYPCGCARSPMWTREQYKVLIIRECTKRNYIFQGFVGEYKNKKTYLKLHNPSNDNTWYTTSVDSFLNQGAGCPLDGIVSASNKLRTPPLEREQQIGDILNIEGCLFISWVGDYKNAYSKFKWTCSEGHHCCTSVDSFINGSRRCVKCSRIKQRDSGIVYGYYPDRVNEPDHLYIIHFKKGNYIKVGRAFDVDARLKGSTGLLKSSGHNIKEIEVLAVFTDTHQEIYNTEQWIHEELTHRGFYHSESDWSTETFDWDCQNVLFYLLNKTQLVKLVSIIE